MTGPTISQWQKRKEPNILLKASYIVNHAFHFLLTADCDVIPILVFIWQKETQAQILWSAKPLGNRILSYG